MAKFAQLMGRFRYEDHGGELTSLPVSVGRAVVPIHEEGKND
jgi:hypothetical protein